MQAPARRAPNSSRGPNCQRGYTPLTKEQRWGVSWSCARLSGTWAGRRYNSRSLYLDIARARPGGVRTALELATADCANRYRAVPVPRCYRFCVGMVLDYRCTCWPLHQDVPQCMHASERGPSGAGCRHELEVRRSQRLTCTDRQSNSLSISL